MRAVWFNQLDFGSLCRTSRLELARAFASLGHSLKIVGRYCGNRPYLGALKPRPFLLKQLLPDPLGGILFQLQALFVAVGEVLKRADLILVDHFCVPTMLPLTLLSKAGLIRTRLVLDIRSSPVETVGIRYTISRWRYNVSIWLAKAFYDGITVITDLYRQDISSRFRIRGTRIGVWSSGVMTDVFDPRRVDTAQVESIKCKLGVQKKLAIMYHGVLSAYRGLQEVVKSLSLLKKEGHEPVAILLLGEGPAAAEIASLARAEGVKDSVIQIQPVPHEQVPKYLSACDAGILPFPNWKWWEMSSPLKLMEYLAMEKPVILTDIPAHRAIMGDAPCAFYIKDNSPRSIARAIRRLADERDALPEIGKQGRDIVLREFTWERQAEKLLDYVRSLRRRKVR